jgi:hypothetical protein
MRAVLFEGTPEEFARIEAYDMSSSRYRRERKRPSGFDWQALARRRLLGGD